MRVAEGPGSLLSNFRIAGCKLRGPAVATLERTLIAAHSTLYRFSLRFNHHLSGTLPEQGLHGLGVLAEFSLQMVEGLEGTLPEVGIAGMSSVRYWCTTGSSRLRGALPDGFGVMQNALYFLGLSGNSLQGSLPEPGLGNLPALKMITLGGNSITGTLPEQAIQRLSNMAVFSLGQTSVSGTLPGLPGFGRLVRMHSLSLLQTKLAGALPVDGFRGMTSLSKLDLSRVRFEGALPSELGRSVHLASLDIGGTSMEGAIPEFLGTSCLHLQLLSLRRLSLKGSVPMSMSRLQHPDMSIILGHGLTGTLPAISSTLQALSIFKNSFEGFLPEMRLTDKSVMVAQSNDFSCTLPSHGHTRPSFALALLGNAFTEPGSGRFPEWIDKSEQGPFFCESNRPLEMLLFKFLGGGLALVASLLCHVDYVVAPVSASSAFSGSPRRPYGERSRVERAFKISFAMFGSQCVNLGLVFLAYLQARPLTCMANVMSHWKLPQRSLLQPSMYALEACAAVQMLLAMLHLCFSCWRRGGIRRQAPLQLIGDSAKEKQPGFWSWSGKGGKSFAQLALWSLWVLVCMVFAAPGAAFAMIKAVPGFIPYTGWLSWCFRHAVSLASALLTSFCLPLLGQLMEGMLPTHVRYVELVIVGKLLTVPVLPYLASFIFDEHCLGAWILLWQPCQLRKARRRNVLNIGVLEHMRTHYTYVLADNKHSTTIDRAEKIVGARDLCSLKELTSPSRCAHSILHGCASFFMSSLLHYTMSTPVVWLISGKRISVATAWVLLAFLWVLLVMLVPPMPAILLPLMVGINVYILLFFGRSAILQRDDYELPSWRRLAKMPSCALGFAVCGVFLLQGSLLLHMPTMLILWLLMLMAVYLSRRDL